MTKLIKDITVHLLADECGPLFRHFDGYDGLGMTRRDSAGMWIEFKWGFGAATIYVEIHGAPGTTDQTVLHISVVSMHNPAAALDALDAFERQVTRLIQERETKIQHDRVREAEAQRQREAREAEARRLREPVARVIKQRKAQSRQRVLELRDQVQADTRNGELRWQLARQLAGIDLPQVLDDDDPFWRDAHFWLPFTLDTEEALKTVELALSIGVSDSITAARAHYLCIILSVSKKLSADVPNGHASLVDDDMTQASPARYSPTRHAAIRTQLGQIPGLKTHCESLINATRRQLKRSPHDFTALYLWRETALILGRTDQADKIEVTISQASRLQEAGLEPAIGTAPVAQPRESTRNDGLDLEVLAKQLLTAMGLITTATKATGDGGIDLVAVSNNPVFSGTYIVQRKDWRSPVGEPIVRDLYGVVTSERANKGILITTGDFTPAAVRFADGKQLELIDGAELARLAKQFSLNWPRSNE